MSLLVVPHLPPEDQLRLVAGSNNLARRPSRYMECNGELETVQSDAVAERVPPGVIRYYQSFFRCFECDRAFWDGSHGEKIVGQLGRVFA